MLRLLSADDGDGKNAAEPAETPCRQIEHITMLLHGLRYGELGDNVSHLHHLSVRLAAVLRLWTSGLLLADYDAHEVDGVASAFETLMLSVEVRDILIWTDIPLEIIDDLVIVLLRRAKHCVDDLSLAERLQPPYQTSQLPAVRAARLLDVVLHLLRCKLVVKSPPQLPSCAHLAMPLLVYVATRVRISIRLYPSALHSVNGQGNGSGGQYEHDRDDSFDDDSISHTIQQLRAQFTPLRHGPSQTAVILQTLPTIVTLAAPTIHKECLLSMPQSVFNPLCVASSIATLHGILDDGLSESARKTTSSTSNTSLIPLPNILDAIEPAIDHTDATTRVTALNIISQLMPPVSDGELSNLISESVAHSLADRLTGALVWNDTASTLRVIPMLVRIMPCLLPTNDGYYSHALSRPPPAAWERAARALLATLEHHGTGVLVAGGKAASVVETVASIAAPVVTAVGARLLPRCTKTVQVLGDAFRCAAQLAARGDVAVNVVACIADAICKVVAVTWPRASAYRAHVLVAVVTAILEVEREMAVGIPGRVDGVEDSVRAAGLSVVEMVGSCGGRRSKRDVADILRGVCNVANGYESLGGVTQFLLEAESIISAAEVVQEEDSGEVRDDRDDVWLGPMMKNILW